MDARKYSGTSGRLRPPSPPSRRRSSDIIARHFNCPVCYEQFSRENPAKALPCGHTFCLQCVGKLRETDPKRSRVECPHCREIHQVPEGGTKDFKTNYLVMQLLDDFEEKKQVERGRDRKRGSSRAAFVLRDLAVNRIEQFHNQISDLQTQADVNFDDVVESIEKTCAEAKERVSAQTREFVAHMSKIEAARCAEIDDKASEEKRRVELLKTEVKEDIKTLANTCKAKDQQLIDYGQLDTGQWNDLQKELEQLSQTLDGTVHKHTTVSFTKVEFLTKNAPDQVLCLDKMGLLHEVESTTPILKLRDGVINIPRGKRLNSVMAEEPRSSSAPPFERRRRNGIRRPSQDPVRRPSRDLSRLQNDRRTAAVPRNKDQRETVFINPEEVGVRLRGQSLGRTPIREEDEDLSK